MNYIFCQILKKHNFTPKNRFLHFLEIAVVTKSEVLEGGFWLVFGYAGLVRVIGVCWGCGDNLYPVR